MEEMYSIPKRPSEYSSLQIAVDGAMVGMEYAAPIAGDNQQSVQQADLTGDGNPEYIVFARTNGEKPLQILVFGQDEEEKFCLMDQVEMSGSTFERVEYVEMDGKPGCELVVGRRLSNETMRIASILSFSEYHAQQDVSTIYTRFLTCDLDSDGQKELMVLRPDESENDHGVAVLYSYADGQMERSRESELSEAAGNVKRVMVSKLSGGENAVYISSSVDGNAIVTDVMMLVDGALTNLAFSDAFSANVQTLQNYYVYADDVDGDGVLELPSLINMKSTADIQEDSKQYLIRWYAVDRDGSEIDKYYTFHNYTGGWYLELDSSWIGRVAVEQEGNTYSFYLWSPDYREATPIFTVYAFSGKERDTQASGDNRFALHRGESVVYAAKLESGSAINGITEQFLTESFHLIYQAWNTGET